MQKRICKICLQEKELKRFSRNIVRGKAYGYKKTCNVCNYDKYCRGKKYGKRFKWTTATLEEKKERTLKTIARRTKRDGECLLWKRPCKKGYGAMMYDGKFSSAHRTSWIIHNGSIPKGMWVLHRCDRPSCVEISHLFLGTPKDNWNDMISKGRDNPVKGSAVKGAKLKEEQVIEIKERIKSGESDTSLGYHFKVSSGAIADIRRGKNWRHVKI